MEYFDWLPIWSIYLLTCEIDLGYMSQKLTNAFNFFLNKYSVYAFHINFETDNFFFWQDTNLLLIQNTYHHQTAAVPWE